MSQNVSYNSDSYQQHFQAGLSALQQKNWDMAIQEFKIILDQRPVQNQLTAEQAGVIYHNLSLAAQEKGETLKAYIWAKKSVTLAPGYKIAYKNLENLSNKIDLPLINHEISTYEQLNKMGLHYVSYDILAITAIVSIFFSVFHFTKFIVTKKQKSLQADLDEHPQKNIKNYSIWFGFIGLIFFAAFLTFANMKWSDLNAVKGIITSAQANVQAGPGENQAVILQLKSATEVEVINRYNKGNEHYIQIRYPGAFSGWVKSSDITVLSDVP